jgi:FkbM family methyltransferase
MKHEKDTMGSRPGQSSTPDPHRVKYEKLGSDQLIVQLRQNEELPKGSIFRVDLPELAHPIYMRAGTSDLWVFDQIFLYKEMETDFGQDVAFIIDAGANIGLTSVYLANRFPSARILALEVDQQNFELLAANTRPYPYITPLLKGLWNRRANLVIDNPEEYAWAFTVSEAGQERSSTVEGISVADLLRDFGWERVDLLKMDIEGAELEVLSLGTEEWLDCVRVLAVEVHYQRIGCWEAFCRIAEQGSFALKWCGEYAVLTRIVGTS